MILSLDVRRARKGDCLLLHFGSKDEPGLVLVDGGPRGVYKPHLRPRIEQVRDARGLSENDSLIVDLLMVSHVDDDHIQGILDLTREELVARGAGRSRLLNVLGLWHNSFDEIIGHKPTELTASVRSHFGAAAVSGAGDLPEDKKIEVEENSAEDKEVVTSALKVLASIEQGFRLRQDAAGLGFERNPHFEGKLIIAREAGKPVKVGEGLKFLVVGPMQAEVEALFKKHQEWLKDLASSGKSPPAALAAYIDKSVPNLSSIVVLAEAGGKRVLLTGDARGDKILKGLQFVGLLEPGESSKIHVDLLKVPHHGSANNLDEDFFERITADHYVFSGNGEHGNPEREAMEMLFKARGKAPYTIHLTYPVEEIDAGRKEDWEKEQGKEKARRANAKAAGKKGGKVRANWSAATNSLNAFFAAKGLAEGQKIEIVAKDKPHVIDLLDPLGF